MIEEQPLVSNGQARFRPLVAVASALGRKRLIVPILVVLTLAFLVLLAMGIRHQRTEVASHQAQAEANAALRNLLSYQSTSVSQDLNRELGLLTGPFRSEYADLMRTTIIPAARKGEVVTRATISASSVTANTTKRARLLVFVNVTTTSKELKSPRTQGSRLVVRVVKVDGKWKISSFSPV